jgi:hypothetical protein
LFAITGEVVRHHQQQMIQGSQSGRADPVSPRQAITLASFAGDCCSRSGGRGRTIELATSRSPQSSAPHDCVAQTALVPRTRLNDAFV